MHPETSLWGSSRKHTMVPGSPGPISSFHSLIENPSKPHPKLQEAPGLMTPDTAYRTLLVRGASSGTQQSPTPAAQHSPVPAQPKLGAWHGNTRKEQLQREEVSKPCFCFSFPKVRKRGGF